jgi:hypothetical protein
MAEMTDVFKLRRMIGELSDAEPWTDQVLSDMIDEQDGDLNQAAVAVWEAKAAGSASFVDVAESGSSRRLSQVNDQALKMVAYYRGLTDSPTEPTDLSGYAYTIPIERP